MFKSLFARYLIILLSCPFVGLTYAYPGSSKDPLQAYQDEIHQSESNASQAVLDALKDTNTDSENTTQQNQVASESPAAIQVPRSNTDKAFKPTDKPSANSSRALNKNPWEQPNPWANQPPNIWEKNAKVNPYANAPIPGPTPPSTSANILSPPNIFAPSQPTHTNNQ